MIRFLVARVVVIASASAVRIAPEMGGDLSISMNIDIQHAEDTVTTDLSMPCDLGHSLTPEVRCRTVCACVGVKCRCRCFMGKR